MGVFNAATRDVTLQRFGGVNGASRLNFTLVLVKRL